jgi:hypothetical protein
LQSSWIVLFLLLALFIAWYSKHRRQTQINQWMDALHLNKHALIYHRLYKPIDGFSLSLQARLGLDAFEYVYGEIDFMTFIALLSLAKPNQDTVFYDLGSGVGKAVIACAMVFNVKKSCGIELFQTLHQCAETQHQKLSKLPTYQKKSDAIHWIHGDFLTMDFSDATLIFINATGFFGEHWEQLNARLTGALSCQTVITTSKKLRSHAFTLTRTTSVRMSWGIVTAYIHHRIERP